MLSQMDRETRRFERAIVISGRSIFLFPFRDGGPFLEKTETQLARAHDTLWIRRTYFDVIDFAVVEAESAISWFLKRTSIGVGPRAFWPRASSATSSKIFARFEYCCGDIVPQGSTCVSAEEWFNPRAVKHNEQEGRKSEFDNAACAIKVQRRKTGTPWLPRLLDNMAYVMRKDRMLRSRMDANLFKVRLNTERPLENLNFKSGFS